MSGPQPHIRLAGLQKHFLRRNKSVVRAIDDISLEIHRGEFVVLLGPSGCGKTSLLRCIAGLETPDAGRLMIGGREIFDSAKFINVPTEKRHVGMMFQSYALWPHMTAVQNVRFPLEMHGWGDARAAEKISAVLKMMRIEDLAQQYPAQLSGGQQQRVALARALACSEELILFDEPLSNIDARVREHLRAELSMMQRELGFTAIYVTHDQEEAMSLADRIVVLGEGKISQSGTPEEIYNRPASVKVAEFIGSANFLEGTATRAGTMTLIRTSLGEFALPVVQVPSQATCVTMVSRPENWRLSADRPEAAHSWRGSIRAAAFLGPHNEYLIDLVAERIRVLSTGARLPIGGDVWCSIDTVDFVVLET